MSLNWTSGFLSGSDKGRSILIATTQSPGTLIHAAVTTAGQFDAVRLYAVNLHVEPVKLILLWGGTELKDTIPTVIYPEQPLTLEVPQLRLNTYEVRAYSQRIANVIAIYGGVETYKPATT